METLVQGVFRGCVRGQPRTGWRANPLHRRHPISSRRWNRSSWGSPDPAGCCSFCCGVQPVPSFPVFISGPQKVTFCLGFWLQNAHLRIFRHPYARRICRHPRCFTVGDRVRISMILSADIHFQGFTWFLLRDKARRPGVFDMFGYFGSSDVKSLSRSSNQGNSVHFPFPILIHLTKELGEMTRTGSASPLNCHFRGFTWFLRDKAPTAWGIRHGNTIRIPRKNP